MKDLTAHPPFGRLTALRPAGKMLIGGQLRTVWECKCECGNSHHVPIGYLTGRKTKSCGCLRQDMARGKANGKHR